MICRVSSRTDWENASTITDDGTDVTIVVDTQFAGAFTIVLEGIGTGSINSFDDLEPTYTLAFV